jgi:hypothetical protein
MPQQQQGNTRQADQDDAEQLDREPIGGWSGGSKEGSRGVRHRHVINQIAEEMCSLIVLVKGAPTA